MPPVVINLRKADDSRDVVHRAVQTLAEGKLVVFPTETVYGLAASARRGDGVRRIFEAKGRDRRLAAGAGDSQRRRRPRLRPEPGLEGPTARPPLLAGADHAGGQAWRGRRADSPVARRGARRGGAQRRSRPARARPRRGARRAADARRADRADQRQPQRRAARRSPRRKRSRAWATTSAWCSTTGRAATARRRPWSASADDSYRMPARRRGAARRPWSGWPAC